MTLNCPRKKIPKSSFFPQTKFWNRLRGKLLAALKVQYDTIILTALEEKVKRILTRDAKCYW